MNFSDQMQRALGDAVLVADEDAIHVVAKGWNFTILRPEEVLDPRVLSLVLKYSKEHRYYVNWRVLSALNIDPERLMFRAPRSHQYEPVLADTYVNMDLRVHKPEPTQWCDEVIDLTEEFELGHARAIYPKKKEGQGFLKRASASAYHFEFGSKIVSVDGDALRALRDAGISILCPRVHISTPPLFLRGDRIRGELDVVPSTGVWESDDGRKLFVDAGICCWATPQSAFDTLTHYENYQITTDPESLWEVVDRKWSATRVRLAVSSLRWMGVEDEEIEDRYENSGRFAAYRTWDEKLQKELRYIRAELLGGTTSTWRVSNIESKLVKICEKYEILMKVIDTDLDILPDVIGLHQELKREAV